MQANQLPSIDVHPPQSLLKRGDPLYVGSEPVTNQSPLGHRAAKMSGVTSMEDVLNSMLPPTQWTESSGVWMQYTSSESSGRLDVLALQENLDKLLAERKAREVGICPVREHLYQQCFDELIRQVAIESYERGLLLLRIRDEIKMTIETYKTLYDSSVVFGVEKQIQSEDGVEDLRLNVSTLEDRKRNLDERLQELRNRAETIERQESERRTADERRRKEEMDFLKHQGQHLDAFLKQMNAISGAK